MSAAITPAAADLTDLRSSLGASHAPGSGPRRLTLSARQIAALEALAGTLEWPAGSPQLERLYAASLADPVTADLAQRLCHVLRESRSVLITNVSTDSEAVTLALFALCAIPSAVGNGVSGDESLVYTIAPTAQPGGDLSTSAHPFPAHTDSTFLREPHHIIGLHCVETSSPTASASFVVGVESVVGTLRADYGDDLVDALTEPMFPFALRDPVYGVGVLFTAVLRPWPVWCIRYRADMVRALLERFGTRCTDRHLTALDALDATLARAEVSGGPSLAPGNFLIVDNQQALHGRTEIAGGSKRVVRRVRGFARQAQGFETIAFVNADIPIGMH